MLAAYADEHVVTAIVQALRRRGMDVVTVQDRGRQGADDAELLTEAFRDQRVMLTNDKDFLILAAGMLPGVRASPLSFSGPSSGAT